MVDKIEKQFTFLLLISILRSRFKPLKTATSARAELLCTANTKEDFTAFFYTHDSS